MAVNPEDFANGDGSTTLFPFTFEYLEESDVKVSVDGVVKTQTTDYTFANATTISFNTAPASGTDNVRIYRDTNVDELKATFFPGSAIRASDLNDNLTQNNYAVQEIKAYYWDNETDTIHSNETWVSSDTQIPTTAAVDARFQDEASETIESGETWVSDDDHIATTAAIDARFQDELSETITSSETWPDNDDTIATTAAIDNRIDTAITNDIGTDGTGITVTDDGDGTITLGLGAGTIDLDRIKTGDIVASGETWANNDTTVATTAMIDDQIDAAITGDILIDSTGLTKVTSGGQTTLGIGAGSVDLDRIKAGDIINLAEQNAGPTTADTSIFTSSAAAKRFDTLVQTATPSGSDYQVGKTWLQNDDDLTLSIWNGTGWTAVSSGGTFTEQPSVVYVDQASGDNANTGHRISTPKATIKAAIEQINAEIGTEITSGGSGYVEGSYTTVALTGGTGTGLTADITVNASGVVSAVTVNSTTTLEDYSIGDVLSASNADLGGSGSGLQITVNGDGDGQIVIVSAGAYPEAAPIQIKRRNVSIIGQSLRSCIVHPTTATETSNLFELNSGSYISNLTLTGVKAGTGTGNTLDAVLPTTQGWNFAFYEDAFITKSPYIQNCTNFSDSEIENDPTNANYLIHNPAGGQAGDTDSAPTGGGLLVNGATPHADSPLRSMVADSYTHVALNGPGILVTNNGYTQITSSYAFFNTYHIKCLNGGQANLAASTTDFGDRSLVADGRSTTNIFTANCVTAVDTSGAAVTTIRVSNGNADASWHGTSTRPASNMLLSVNSDAQIYPITNVVPQDQTTFDSDPAGYTGDWIVTISRPDPNNRSNNLGFSADVATGTDNVQFWLRSMIASSGHTMEYVGSGTNYTALPENGGVPIEARQITELNNGKVWTAITDHNGKFRIGGNQTDDPIFEVDQQLGFVTIPEGSIAFNLLSDLTPQLGGDLDVNSNTITGLPDAPSANSEAASKKYVDDQVAGANSISQGNSYVEVTDSGTGVIDVNVDGTSVLAIDVDNLVPDLNVDFPDNKKARFGTGNDLEIYHDGSRSIIRDQGTGSLEVLATNFVVKNAADNKNAIFAADGGATTLYHNGSEKLATTSSGINVTGSVSCDGLTSDGDGFLNIATGGLYIKDTGNSGTGSTPYITGRDSANSDEWYLGSLNNANNALYIRNVNNDSIRFGTNNIDRCVVNENGHFVPLVDDTYDLGTSTNQWRNAYFDGTVNCDGLTSEGTITVSSGDGRIDLKDSDNTGNAAVNYIRGLDSGSTQQWYVGNVDSSQDIYLANTQTNGDIIFQTTGSSRVFVHEDGHFMPINTNTYDLGGASNRWRDIYTEDIDVNATATLQGKVVGIERTATASAFDLNNGNFWTFGAIAVPNPTNQSAGMSGLLRVTAAPTSFAANWKFPGGSYTAPTSFPAVAPFFVQASGTILVGNWTEGIT